MLHHDRISIRCLQETTKSRDVSHTLKNRTYIVVDYLRKDVHNTFAHFVA